MLEIAYIEIGFATSTKRRGVVGLRPVHMRHRIWKRSQRVEMSMEFPSGESHDHANISLEAYEKALLALPVTPESE